MVGAQLRIVYGGVALNLPANRARDLLALPGVVAVQRDGLAQPLTDSSPEFIGAPTLYDAMGSDTPRAKARSWVSSTPAPGLSTPRISTQESPPRRRGAMAKPGSATSATTR